MKLLHTRVWKIIKHPEQKSTLLIINVNLKGKKESVSSSRINLQYKICIEKSGLFHSAHFYCLMGEKLNDAENITSTWCEEAGKAVESWGRGFRSCQLLSSLERSHRGLLSPKNRASGWFNPDAVSIRGKEGFSRFDETTAPTLTRSQLENPFVLRKQKPDSPPLHPTSRLSTKHLRV